MLSGKNTDRPGLKAMLDYIREGDVVFVESISRLARSKMFRCIMLTGIYGLKDHNGFGKLTDSTWLSVILFIYYGMLLCFQKMKRK